MRSRGRVAQAIAGHPFLPIFVTGSSAAHRLFVWDVITRSLLRTLEGHTSWVYCIVVDPAGRRLVSGADDRSVRLWDLDSGTCLHTMMGHTSFVLSVEWDSTGSLVASGSNDDTVRIWDAETGAARHTLTGHSFAVNALVAHPADDLLASGSADKIVLVWRWSTGERIWKLSGHSMGVYSLAASAAFLVSGSEDRTVRVWSWTTGACIRTLEMFRLGLWRNSLSWRGQTLVTLEGDELGGGGAVRLWDVASEDPRAWTCEGRLAAQASSCSAIALVEGGRVAFLAPGDPTAISVWCE